MGLIPHTAVVLTDLSLVNDDSCAMVVGLLFDCRRILCLFRPYTGSILDIKSTARILLERNPSGEENGITRFQGKNAIIRGQIRPSFLAVEGYSPPKLLINKGERVTRLELAILNAKGRAAYVVVIPTP